MQKSVASQRTFVCNYISPRYVIHVRVAGDGDNSVTGTVDDPIDRPSPSPSVMDSDSSASEERWSASLSGSESFVVLDTAHASNLHRAETASTQQQQPAASAASTADHVPISDKPAPTAHHVPRVFVAGQHLVDDRQRVLNLRGVSLSGNCKLPAEPHLPTHSGDEAAFFDTQVCPLYTAEPVPRGGPLNRPLLRFVLERLVRRSSFSTLRSPRGKPLFFSSSTRLIEPSYHTHLGQQQHLSRLSEWGLTFIRLVVTWEALEHAGPCVIRGTWH
jgi:hypothetical protein